MNEPIPFINLRYSHEALEAETLAAISKVLHHGQYILGPEVALFEQEWAEFSKVKYCVGMASGLDALQAGLLAMGVKAGDKVLMPVNGFIATAFAIEAIGAEIVFCDVDATTQNISLETLKPFSGKGIKAVIPVQLYGLICPMDEIMDWANQENVLVLEDAAQAHGAVLNGKGVGTWGKAGIFSFYPTKNLGAAGDAGCLITNDEAINSFSQKWRNYGMEKRFHHEIVGRNARMDAMQAAILSVRLKHLGHWNADRQKIAARYQSLLQDCQQITLPPLPNDGSHVYHLYVIQCEQRDELQAYLSEKGIGTNIQYPIPIHLQLAMQHLGLKAGAFPIAENLATRILSLPNWPGMTTEMVERVAKAVKGFYNR